MQSVCFSQSFACLQRKINSSTKPRSSVNSYLPNSENAPRKNEVQKTESKIGITSRVSLDPFRGKSGSISFVGLTHENMDRRKLVSSPLKDDIGSFVWVVAPLALISSLLLPQFFLGNTIEGIVKNEILTEIVSSFLSEILFYAGFASFLFITNCVQQPYLDYSAKQWSLITGLKGYLSSAFFVMGIKIFAPLLAAYATYPIIGIPSVIAVAPFLLGCAVQYGFELYLARHSISCWPLIPIIFEVYRLYQLNKGAHFLERMMFSMREAPMSPELLEKSSALFSMVTMLQVLGLVCLWSLTSFLLRLFPSRPVAENY